MKGIKIISITGPSGVGKTTLARELLRLNPRWGVVLSITTREPRPSDLPGEYRYVSYKEFLKKESRGEFIWTTGVHGVWHGTLRASLDEALAREGVFLIFLTPDLVSTLHEYAPERVLSLFLTPPSDIELARRLRQRGEDEEAIEQRIEDCAQWLAEAKESMLPYVFVDSNGSIDATTERVRSFFEEV